MKILPALVLAAMVGMASSVPVGAADDEVGVSSAYAGPIVYPPPPNYSFPAVIVVHDVRHGNIFKVFGPFKNQRQIKYFLVNNEQFWKCEDVVHDPCYGSYTVERLYKPDLSELVD